MENLTYEELILLNSLVYLNLNAKEDELLIDIVYNLLSNGRFDENMNKAFECITRLKESEWVAILEQIIRKPNLPKLRIKNIESYKNGMEFACFTDDENDVVVVFRGTATVNEWEDNGTGVYEGDTMEQIEALNYVNSLNYDNITVTGHSKGGNKAQYVAILSQKVAKCVSVNGQGFSNEFISKYNKEINANKFKIISINAKYDYINCLFNSISGETHYIKTDIQINSIYYHKPNILLDSKGNLRRETTESLFSKIINDFSKSLISILPKDMKSLVSNKVVDVIELILCKNDYENNIVKLAEEIFITFSHENYLEPLDIFEVSYQIAIILMIPLLFWSNFVNIEENHSIELIDKVIKDITLLKKYILMVEITDRDLLELVGELLGIIDEFIFRLSLEKDYMI